MLDSSRAKRKLRIRRRVSGTPDRLRLSIFRSAKHIYAQIVDDTKGLTLVTASTQSKEVREKLAGLKKTDEARLVGKVLAELCKAKNITTVVFDRNGFIYHGRVAALADGAREAGLKF
jgi:large subunit ribosomal protein L18